MSDTKTKNCENCFYNYPGKPCLIEVYGYANRINCTAMGYVNWRESPRKVSNNVEEVTK